MWKSPQRKKIKNKKTQLTEVTEQVKGWEEKSEDYRHGREWWHSDYWRAGTSSDYKSRSRYTGFYRISRSQFYKTTNPPRLKTHRNISTATINKMNQNFSRFLERKKNQWFLRLRKTHLAMKLQWLCLITCHMTSSCCIFNKPLSLFHCYLVCSLDWKVRVLGF